MNEKKSVLYSIKPYYFYLIAEGIKTIEVRGRIPLSMNWDRGIWLHVTRDKKSFERIPEERRWFYEKYLGKVGAHFKCNTILTYRLNPDDWTYDDYPYLLNEPSTGKDCLSPSELIATLRDREIGYGLVISNLFVLDKPLEYKDFTNAGDNKPLKAVPQSYVYVLNGIVQFEGSTEEDV